MSVLLSNKACECACGKVILARKLYVYSHQYTYRNVTLCTSKFYLDTLTLKGRYRFAINSISTQVSLFHSIRGDIVYGHSIIDTCYNVTFTGSTLFVVGSYKNEHNRPVYIRSPFCTEFPLRRRARLLSRWEKKNCARSFASVI